ncbi:DUF6090 family protein [Ulvibacter antarcticus]|uniref:Uncharacterized protein n=1 Tax=Ulvibacter antarcticus TaxID=442714 RepID=A0A3L9ZB20_9FLAO|nr:DUF6090 family protein [Ulvibacter antarcticus]RMA67515.1 hypothetical protein BXY75_0069 [Ulvibacter antarcticus]
MIKFFRKIRQKMLTENKFSKYFLYAIGEIILVVIGILVALQINNWNQNQSDRKNEVTILEELKKEFEENSIRYEETIKAQTFALNSNQSFLLCLEKKNLNYKRDSIAGFILYGPLNYFRAEPVIGAYQSINASGNISLIQNSVLKSKLAAFSSEISQGFEDEESSMDLLNLLNAEFSSILEPLMPTEIREQLGLKQSQNMDIEYQNNALSKLYENQNIMSLTLMRGRTEYNRLYLQKKMLTYTDEIIDLINNELNTEK